jgi:hypothetical protein
MAEKSWSHPQNPNLEYLGREAAIRQMVDKSVTETVHDMRSERIENIASELSKLSLDQIVQVEKIVDGMVTQNEHADSLMTGAVEVLRTVNENQGQDSGIVPDGQSNKGSLYTGLGIIDPNRTRRSQHPSLSRQVRDRKPRLPRARGTE